MTPLADGIHSLMKTSGEKYARTVFNMQPLSVQAEILKAAKCKTLEALLEKLK